MLLIQRLEEDWREVETGKAYWIGYTKDMYSIAAHGDDAIYPLLSFIKKAKSNRAKYGAILSLHLIGIDRKIAGRFYEEFKKYGVTGISNASLRISDIALIGPYTNDSGIVAAL